VFAGQVPTTGFVEYQLLPGNMTIGEAGVLVDSQQGIAYATIVKSPKEEGIYGIPPPGQWLGIIHPTLRVLNRLRPWLQ
jgi:hypothetical protein